MNDLEQRAHDLAVIFVQHNLDSDEISCEPAHVFDLLKEYEHFYQYALNSFEDVYALAFCPLHSYTFNCQSLARLRNK